MPKYICENCGSSDVEELEWRKVNTGEYSGQCDLTNNTWCCACETHCAIIDESDKEKVE
ncbi:MAG: hypothetical protein H8D23_21640 [Candidatus Brocadiales bacterium]|nr:hypothetical protein [Candidatus Brocadiales bacterium]